MTAELQEILALLVVGLVVGIALWRRWRRRGAGAPGCGSCDKPAAKSREIPLRFHRRKP